MIECEHCKRTGKYDPTLHCRYCGFKVEGVDLDHVTYHGLVKHFYQLLELGFEREALTRLKDKLQTKLGM